MKPNATTTLVQDLAKTIYHDQSSVKLVAIKTLGHVLEGLLEKAIPPEGFAFDGVHLQCGYDLDMLKTLTSSHSSEEASWDLLTRAGMLDVLSSPLLATRFGFKIACIGSTLFHFRFLSSPDLATLTNPLSHLGCLDPETRTSCLRLCNDMIQVCGNHWIIDPESKFAVKNEKTRGQFCHLILQLARIEILLLLENIGEQDAVLAPHSKAAVSDGKKTLAACFEVTEGCLGALLAAVSNVDSDATDDISLGGMSAEVILSIQKTGMDIINAAINFIDCCNKESVNESIVALACVRLIALWLAEDYDSIANQIIPLLRFMLTLHDSSDMDVMQLLLPAMERLCEDLEATTVLLECNVLNRLIALFRKTSNMMAKLGYGYPSIWELHVRATAILQSILFLAVSCAENDNAGKSFATSEDIRMCKDFFRWSLKYVNSK